MASREGNEWEGEAEEGGRNGEVPRALVFSGELAGSGCYADTVCFLISVYA